MESLTPVAVPDEHPVSELRQITICADEEIARVNELLIKGWRLLAIGQRAEASVYVLGRTEQKRRQRTGFLTE